MKSNFMRTVELLIVTLVVAGAMPKESGHPLLQDPGADSAIQVLDAWIEVQLDAHDLPGLSIGLVVDQDFVQVKGCGYADVCTPACLNPDML